MRFWIFWMFWMWMAGCRREIPEWDIFLDIPVHSRPLPQKQNRTTLTLPLPAGGSAQAPGEEHVLLADESGVLVLDASGRRILAAGIPPAPQSESENTDATPPVLFWKQRSELLLLRHDTLWRLIPGKENEFRPWIKIPETALCGTFRPPLENHLQAPEDFAIDRAQNLCIRLTDAASPQYSVWIAVEPETGTVKNLCPATQNTASAAKNTPPDSAVCQMEPKAFSAPSQPAWTLNEAACALDIEGIRVLLLPDDEDPAGCRARPHGQDASRIHSVWCISESDEEYASQTCFIVDHRRRLKLEPAVEIPPDEPVRWSPRFESVILGNFLFFLQADPVRFLRIDGKTIRFL